MLEVRIVKTTHVPLSQFPAPPLDLINLSFFDAPWVALPPIQRLLIFAASDHLPPFPSLLGSLKSSLSTTLSRYYALAGKLTFLQDTGGIAIDCSPAAVGSGVAFAEAEAGGDAGLLAAREEHDVEAFARLMPEMAATDLPAPVMAVQATMFAGGGVAVGVAVHHALVDGKAVWRFMEEWAKCCRGEEEGGGEKPSFDRAVIRHPNADEATREFLRFVAPDLPKINSWNAADRFKLARRTFTLDSHRIQVLKQIILELGASRNSPPTSPPSTFVSVAAKFWTAFVHSKSMNPTDDTHIFFIVDCRTRLDPPVGDGYFGNCIKGCCASAIAGDLLAGEDGILFAASAIQKAVREALEKPLQGCDDWMLRLVKANLPFNRLANVAASPRFRVYEMDFGWGKPDRVELVSMNHDGEIALAASKDEGGVQASVALNPMHMEGFKSHFLNF